MVVGMTTMHNRERMRGYQAHNDLLSQVADSTEERDNVRRILGAETRQPGMRNLNAPRIESGQLSERDLDAAQRWRDQPDLERDPPRAGDLLRVVALFLAAWASIATTLLVINT